jgi:glycolate oxidase FAD binding subunit
MSQSRPDSAAELSDTIASSREPFSVRGGNSKFGFGRPVEAAAVLDLSAFGGVIAYEPDELIIEAGAATRLDEIEALLDKSNQMLAFEPAYLSGFYGTSHSGTLGGVLGCNLSGPRRLTAGAARDHILGIHGVDGRGTVFKGGGRVVKNVTGYDMPKLMAGSHGTLAAITSVVFKVLPKPETEDTVLVTVTGARHAVDVMSMAMGSPCVVSSAAYVPGLGVGLRLEGIASSVNVRREQLTKLLEEEIDILSDTDSLGFWTSVRDIDLITRKSSSVVWRVSTTPGDAPGFIAAILAQQDVTYLMDWAGGLVWLGFDDATLNVRRSLTSGHATLMKASADVRHQIPVFQPQNADLAALTARVKLALDPQRKLNPGRMYKDV